MDPVRWGSVLSLSLSELLVDQDDAAAEWLKSDGFVKALGESLGENWCVENLRIFVTKAHVAISFCGANDAAPVYLCFQLTGSTDERLAWLLTQATGKRFAKLILVTSVITPEQEAQIRWLNDITPEGFDLYAIELKVFKEATSDLGLPLVTAVIDKRGLQRKSYTINPPQVALFTSPIPVVNTMLPFTEFWLMFNAVLLKRKSAIAGQKPSNQNWVTYPIDEYFKLVASLDAGNRSCSVGLVITGAKFTHYYDTLMAMKPAIEAELRVEPCWEVKNTRGLCRIYVKQEGFDMPSKDNWSTSQLWLATMLERFHAVFELKVSLLTLQDKFSSARDVGIQQKIHWETASGL